MKILSGVDPSSYLTHKWQPSSFKYRYRTYNGIGITSSKSHSSKASWMMKWVSDCWCCTFYFLSPRSYKYPTMRRENAILTKYFCYWNVILAASSPSNEWQPKARNALATGNNEKWPPRWCCYRVVTEAFWGNFSIFHRSFPIMWKLALDNHSLAWSWNCSKMKSKKYRILKKIELKS